jgi:hypothetical protein
MSANKIVLLQKNCESKNKENLLHGKPSFCCLDLKVNCKQAKDLYNIIKDKEDLGNIFFYYSHINKPNEEWPLMSNCFLNKYQDEDTVFFKIELSELKVSLKEVTSFVKKTMESVSSLRELTLSSGVVIDSQDNQMEIVFI